MHSLRLRCLPFLFVGCTVLVLGCGSEGEVPFEEPCRPGTVRTPNGQCVRAGTGNGPGGENGPGGVSNGPPTGLSCTPGERLCADASTLATCDDTGAGLRDHDPCPEDSTCEPSSSGARCVFGASETCTPGAFVRCADPSSAIHCGDDGTPDSDSPIVCEGASPNCVEGLGCSDSLCSPGRRQCDGDHVVLCSDDGSSLDRVTECPYGCMAGTCIDPCAGGDKDSYLGCEFLALYLDNVGTSGGERRPFAVTVSNTSRTEGVDVSILDHREEVVAQDTIGPGQLVTFTLPGRDAGGTEVHDHAYRVVASGAVTVHQFNPLNNEGAFSNDASLLFPTNALGTEYDVMSWPRIADRGGFLAIVAANPQGPTEVRVRPTAAVPAGQGVPAIPAGQWATITLQPGQAVNLSTDVVHGDFTGTRIEADHPVAVFAGAQSTMVPLDVYYADHLEQQLFPTSTWGDHYVVPKFRPRGTETDVFRVMVREDGTRLETDPAIPGVDGTLLQAGAFVEFEEARHFEIRGVQDGTDDPAPILVAQFMAGSNHAGIPATCPAGCGGFLNPCGTGIGDPTFVLNVPTRQFLDDYVFFVPSDYRQNHLSIVSPSGTSIELDGQPVTAQSQPVGSTGWVVTHVDVQAGVRRLNASANVGLYVYGYDCDVSYGYPGGMNLEP